MPRIVFNHSYMNLSLPSVSPATGTATSQPEYKPGMEVKADSGIYRYLQAQSTVSEGYVCFFERRGQTNSNYYATPGTTTDAGSAGGNSKDWGVCVASGGLAVKQWGWFWLGEGEEWAYAAGTGGAYCGNVGTWTTAGQLSVTSALTQYSGRAFPDVFFIDSTANTSTGLRLCRAARILVTNWTSNGT